MNRRTNINLRVAHIKNTNHTNLDMYQPKGHEDFLKIQVASIVLQSLSQVLLGKRCFKKHA